MPNERPKPVVRAETVPDVLLGYLRDAGCPLWPGTEGLTVEPDFASLFALADAPSLGQAFDDAGWAKLFDRTQWVLTIWFPFESGDTGEPSVWPNSPPFPAP